MHVDDETAKNLPYAEKRTSQATDEQRRHYRQNTPLDDCVQQRRAPVEIGFMSQTPDSGSGFKLRRWFVWPATRLVQLLTFKLEAVFGSGS